MKKEFLPYYISRAALSAIFALLVMGFNWKAALFALVLFGLFLLYLHSGWFSIDLKYPLFPLRRDPRGQEIQRKALIASVVAGLLIYLNSPHLSELVGLPFSGNIALSIGIITYFITQFILLGRN
ncbi:MAG: hypothetical protein WBB69_04190 [Anaerolineales bacterium]